MINVGFIGAGNMGFAIMKGVAESKTSDNANSISLFAYDIDTDKINRLKELGVTPCESIKDVIEKCKYVFLAVKPQQLDEVLDCMASMKGIHVRGLMTVAPKPQAEAEAAFECMHKLFVDRKEKKIDNVNMDLLSMGMSADFALALRHGANLVRIGSAIFADETRRL